MAKRLDIPEETMNKVKTLLEEKKTSKFWSYRLSFAGISEATGVSINVIEGIHYHRRSYDGITKRAKLTQKQVDRVKKKLLDKDFGRIKISYREIADAEGIPYNTVWNIHNGHIYRGTGS